MLEPVPSSPSGTHTPWTPSSSLSAAALPSGTVCRSQFQSPTQPASRHPPEAACHITHARTQHCRRQKIGTPRDKLAAQIPSIHSSSLSTLQCWLSTCPVPRPRHNVQIVRLLLPDKLWNKLGLHPPVSLPFPETVRHSHGAKSRRP